MLKQTSIFIFLLTLVFSQASAQTFAEQFNDLVSKNDTLGQKQLLEKWEKTDNTDPELFVAYFNYYVITSKNEIIAIGQNPKGEDVLQISDPDTTQKEPVGYIYGDTYYDPVLLAKSFEWINNGIAKFPNRLDMRFGKIYMLGEIEDYEKFTEEIIKTIDYSSINQNKWTWSVNVPLDDPKESMLGSIQNYQVQLYNLENDELLENMKRIAETVLKYYPDDVVSLSNLSVVFLIQEQYDKALEVLLKAEKLNPKDYVVLGNIAQAYKLKGDKKNAIKYYKLASKHGDEQVQEYAKEQIEELKKQ